MQQRITPFLWFDTEAEDAMNFYVSIFKNSKVINIGKNGEKVFSVQFELDGQKFSGMNAGPHFKFNEAISMFVHCENQEEVDYYWDKLVEGGEPSQCGWLKDKFGLSWQIIPKQLGELMEQDESGKVMEAMMKMIKIDVSVLQNAFDDK